MSNCCIQSVPPDSSLKAFGQPLLDWQKRLIAGLDRSVDDPGQTLGHIEEEIARKTRDLERTVAQEVAQKKADTAPPICPVCKGRLSRLTHGHKRTIQTRFGEITIQRSRGWCRKCKQWRYPADDLLGVADGGSSSPSVQEMAALVGSKMPIAEASAVIERLTGVTLPQSTLHREAARQGKRAQELRDQLDAEMKTALGAAQEIHVSDETKPFTLVIELDAWNIRERDDWGLTAQKIRAGQKPERWHWVYAATCFRLDDRITKGERAVICSRGTVMTRMGIDALKTQLWAEAMRHGLGRAARVLVIADGAVWIWNLVEDRFERAVQRLDLFHAKEHLWAVAQTLYPEEPEKAQAWVKPLLRDLERDRAEAVISTLEEQLAHLRGSSREAVKREINYFGSNLHRMRYRDGGKRGEPLGSGAIESTCRQYQCRFKRPGQFWTREGDEALICLETFWRNRRWPVLFPHSAPTDLSKN